MTMAPKPGGWCLVRRGRSDPERHTMMEAEIRVTCLQAREHLGLPTSTGSWRQAWNRPSRRTPGGTPRRHQDGRLASFRNARDSTPAVPGREVVVVCDGSPRNLRNPKYLPWMGACFRPHILANDDSKTCCGNFRKYTGKP